MFDSAFLTGDDLAYLVGTTVDWLAYGIGLGAVLWVIGRCIALIFSFVRY